MKASTLLPLALACSTASADTLFVGTYAGTIESLRFDPDTGALSRLSCTNASAPGPSWQELSANKKFLYTVEETSPIDASRGAVTSYSIGPDAKLTRVASALGMASPVSLALSPDQKLIFTANYGSASCSIYATDPNTGAVIWRGDLNFTLEAPGPVPDRQAAAHPHQALFDPTGKFIVVPDLGADLIRLFAVQPSAPMGVAEIAPVKVRPGTGPRHGVFWPRTGRARFYYLVGELDNTVTTFKVRYTKAGMQFTQTQTLSTLPAGYNSPNPAYAGEIVLSPSQNHIYVSNRLDTVFPDSNSIAAYGIPDIRDGKSTGALSQHEFFPSGVNNTRHFTIHPRGQWMLNAGSVSNDIKTWRLDERSGRVLTGQSMGGKVFSIEKPVCLTWL